MSLRFAPAANSAGFCRCARAIAKQRIRAASTTILTTLATTFRAYCAPAIGKAPAAADPTRGGAAAVFLAAAADRIETMTRHTQTAMASPRFVAPWMLSEAPHAWLTALRPDHRLAPFGPKQDL